MRQENGSEQSVVSQIDTVFGSPVRGWRHRERRIKTEGEGNREMKAGEVSETSFSKTA